MEEFAMEGPARKAEVRSGSQKAGLTPASRSRAPPLIPAKAGTQGVPIWRRLQYDPPIAFYVYILASRRNGTLYVGMSDDLSRRMWEHQEKALRGFTSRYGVTILVWFEVHETREEAFARERAIKKWNRKWKIELIVANNSGWNDLTAQIPL